MMYADLNDITEHRYPIRGSGSLLEHQNELLEIAFGEL